MPALLSLLDDDFDAIDARDLPPQGWETVDGGAFSAEDWDAIAAEEELR